MNFIQNSKNIREGEKILNQKTYCEKNTKVKKETKANINSERLNAFPVILGKRKISTNTTSI